MNGQRPREITSKCRVRPIALAVALGVTCLVALSAPTQETTTGKTVVIRVNQVPVTVGDVEERREKFYPASSAYGGLRPEKLKEIRAKAVKERIVDELVWQQAGKPARRQTSH